MRDQSGTRSWKVEKDRPIERLRFPNMEPSLWDETDKYLQTRRLSPLLAELNGWYPTLVRDRARGDYTGLVIPATNSADFPYWQVRALDPTVEPKYESPGIPRKDSIIVCWPDARRVPKPGVVAVVEGPMDALAAAGAGVVGVATMGAYPSAHAFDYIARLFDGRTVLVIPDLDMRKAGVTTLQALRSRGMSAWLRLLPSGRKDLNDCTLQEQEKIMEEL